MNHIPQFYIFSMRACRKHCLEEKNVATIYLRSKCIFTLRCPRFRD